MEEYNTRIANGDIHVTLQSLLNEYERVRWLPCFEIFWKAAFLGYLETGGINGFYSKFRDAFFKSMGIIGVASKVLLNAATPKVWPIKLKHTVTTMSISWQKRKKTIFVPIEVYNKIKRKIIVS